VDYPSTVPVSNALKKAKDISAASQLIRLSPFFGVARKKIRRRRRFKIGGELTCVEFGHGTSRSLTAYTPRVNYQLRYITLFRNDSRSNLRVIR